MEGIVAISAEPVVIHQPSARRGPKGGALLRLVQTTDHKQIGTMYLITPFAFFMAGGVMALLMRGELAVPGTQFLSPEQYNQLFTMHGTVMMLLYATPNVFGFANAVLPLQIGSPDVAFPRLNALSYWLYLFGGLIVMSGFLTPNGAADFGWFADTPLSRSQFSPNVGGGLWAAGLIVGGLSTILGAVNMLTTVICLRAPGMTMWRLPIFTWNMVFTSILVLIAFPIFTAALFGLLADRTIGAHVFDPANGGSILWQHLFWFFGHPEVYIVALPYFGITTFLIAVPTGIKFFNWIGTMWRGQIVLSSPMLFSIGFMVTFLLGGLTGILLAAPPIDFHVHDTYFVVAHFHYVLFGTIVFATFAGLYFWFPKITGRMLDERLGKLHFWTTFLGFHLTFLVHHWLGNQGMPRRYIDYQPTDNFTTLHAISTIGAFLLGLSVLPFLYNVIAATATAPLPTPTTLGATATPWNGPPPAHHHDTTSPNSPRSAPNSPPSNCITPDMIERFRNESRQCPHRAEERPPHPSRKPQP
jgi:cytochrome c oxidase subunit 1